MERFDYDDNTMKADDKSSRFWCELREIKKLFRIAEIFIVLVLLTWTSTRLPFAVRISGEYFRRLASIVLSHLFVFFLTNAIVLILFFKSRTLFLHHATFRDDREIHVDFCQQFITDDGGGGAYFDGDRLRRAEEIVYQDKQTILEVTTTKVRAHNRSRSASFRREKNDCGWQLRRSETEIERRVVEEETAAEVVDELSNGEFQRAIEAFIAKQIKFRQQEKLAIVRHECN